MHCADTSFLCALYRQQSHSESAIATLEAIGGPIVISPLLAYEFRQAVRVPSVPALPGCQERLSGD